MDNLRSNILKTAEKLFVKYGIRSVSIDDICNELHISKKTFYTEFRQKDEIVSLVLVSITEQNRKEDKECTALVNSTNAIDFALSYRHPALRERKKKNEKFMHDLIKYYPEIHARFIDSRRDAIKEFICGNILRGVKEGLFRGELENTNKDSVIVSLILNIFLTMVTPSIDEESVKKEEIFDLKVDCYLRMVCNAEGIKYYEQKNV